MQSVWFDPSFVRSSLLPVTTNLYNLGSASFAWQLGYINSGVIRPNQTSTLFLSGGDRCVKNANGDPDLASRDAGGSITLYGSGTSSESSKVYIRDGNSANGGIYLSTRAAFPIVTEVAGAEILRVDAGFFTSHNSNGVSMRFRRLGTGVQFAEGANARMGVVTLIAGTLLVNNNTVTATTRIFHSREAPGGVLGELSTSRVNGTSFTINSSNVADTSVVNWVLFEPSI